MTAPATAASVAEVTAEVALAYDLIVLRDLADANHDRATYRKAFVALAKLDMHHIAAAEQMLKAEVGAQTRERGAA